MKFHQRRCFKFFKKGHVGDDKLKKFCLKTLRRKKYLFQIENDENVAKYFNKIMTITNHINIYNEVISNQTIVNKVMYALSFKFIIF